MDYQWNWGVFTQIAVGNETYLDWLLSGLLWTLSISLISWFLALFLGIVIGILRTVPSRSLRFLAACYVEALRNVPLLVQLFFWYFVWPELLPKGVGNWMKDLAPYIQQLSSGILCLSLFTSARIAEQVRSGINSLAGGQKNAGLALGLTLPQTYRHILLPQSMRIILPPLTSELLNIFKNSSVVSTIGLLELTKQAQQLNDYTAQPYESFLAVTIIYVILNIILMVIMRAIERKTRVPGLIVGG